ncbi:MAG: hypothetical protein ACWIPH_08885 [Ostreibacterium sp.]
MKAIGYRHLSSRTLLATVGLVCVLGLSGCGGGGGLKLATLTTPNPDTANPDTANPDTANPVPPNLTPPVVTQPVVKPLPKTLPSAPVTDRARELSYDHQYYCCP